MLYENRKGEVEVQGRKAFTTKTQREINKNLLSPSV